ncbi:MAG: hypothetical protein ABIJ65_11260, partial [Chloroflexota bacterium]
MQTRLNNHHRNLIYWLVLFSLILALALGMRCPFTVRAKETITKTYIPTLIRTEKKSPPLEPLINNNEISEQTCNSAPSTGFLYLPFDTSYNGQNNDWFLKMTSAFDHHYPDYTCSEGNKNERCIQRGMRIVLWEGEEARP